MPRPYRRALAILDDVEGAPPDAAIVAGNLGLLLLSARGELHEAETLLERSLGEHQRAFGVDHPRLVPVLVGLAKIALARGAVGPQTIERLERAVSIANRGGVSDEDAAAARQLLARLRDGPG